MQEILNNIQQAFNKIFEVCSRCGGEIIEKNITTNDCMTNHKDYVQSHRVCMACSIIEWGVRKEVFELGKKMADFYGYDPEYSNGYQVGKMCSLINKFGLMDTKD